jgi:molybdopterin biosynthesis enzyme
MLSGEPSSGLSKFNTAVVPVLLAFSFAGDEKSKLTRP